MYNRYIPQADGSYHRSFVADPPEPETENPEPLSIPEEPHPAFSEHPSQSPVEPPRRRLSQSRQQPAHRPPRKEPVQTSPLGITGFLRQLIPSNLDAEDLIVVLLLLLMSGESQDDQNGALLTLALYLFL